MAKKTNPTQEINCLNCGHPFSGKEKFCPECGQKNKGNKLILKDFIREVFAGFLSWDAKFWKTLLPLFIKPGKISKDYIEGKRARYTNPFRFFFIISIIFFFLVKMNSKNKFSFNEDSVKTKNDTIHATVFNKDMSKYLTFQKKHPKLKPEIALDSLKEEQTFLNKLLYSRSKTINDFSENTGETTQKLITLGFSYISTAFFLLLPIFALFFKLIYIRRKLNYMNHLIFIFHISTFFFICLTLFELFSFFSFSEKITKTNSFNIISVSAVFFLYPFIAMKTFYEQSNFKTFLKLFITSIVFSILITLTITLIFLLAFFMM